MSKRALSDLLNSVLSSIPIEELGKVASDKEKVQTPLFRKNLNKTIHLLIINDYFIKALAPRAEEVLKSLPQAKNGPNDPNPSAIRAVLSEYRNLRGNKRGRVRKTALDNNSEGYVLTFPSYEAVRSFLSKLGLKGRSSEVYNFVTNNQDIKRRLADLLGTYEVFDNETSLVKALSSISPANNKKSKDPFYQNKEAEELYRIVYDEDLGFDVGHNIPVAYKQVEILANNKAHLKNVVDKFLRHLDTRKIVSSAAIDSIVRDVQKQALVNAKKTSIENNFIINKSSLDFKGSGRVEVFIESSKFNQDSESEARILNEFKLLLLNRIKQTFKDRYANYGKLLNQEGSKSYKDQMIDNFVSIIVDKPIKREKSSTQKVKLVTKINTAKSSIKTTSSTQQVKVAPLRSVSGKFTSLANLEVLIKSMLEETVSKNMQRPNLEYQSGRFAKSVELKSLSRKGDAIQAFLTYMKYPYQTFEPGFKQGHKGYDPRRLIDQSVREIATKLVKARLQTVFV